MGGVACAGRRAVPLEGSDPSLRLITKDHVPCCWSATNSMSPAGVTARSIGWVVPTNGEPVIDESAPLVETLKPEMEPFCELATYTNRAVVLPGVPPPPPPGVVVLSSGWKNPWQDESK